MSDNNADDEEKNAPANADSMLAEDETQNLYKIVAEQDPAWFEEFVINILGKDAVGMEWTSGAAQLSATRAAFNDNNAATSRRPSKLPPLTPDVDELESSSQRLADTEQLQSANDFFIDLEDTKSEEEKLDELTEPIPVEEVSNDIPSDPAATADFRAQISDPKNEVVDSATAELQDVSFLRDSFSTESNSSRGILPSSPSEATTAKVTKGESEEVVVMFKEPLARSWSRVPFIRFLELGYQEADVTALDPRALDSIATGGIMKPRSGIPSRWKTSKDDDLSVVMLVKKGEAEEYEKESSRRQALINSFTENRPEPKPDQNYGDQPSSLPSSSGQRNTGKSYKTPEEKIALSSDSNRMAQKKGGEVKSKTSLSRPPDDGMRAGRSTEGSSKMNPTRSQDNDDSQIHKSSRGEPEPLTRGNKKAESAVASPDSQRLPSQPQRYGESNNRKIYNGRGAVRSETSRNQRRPANDDPPQPKSGFWPDIDSFRNMLRNEAGLRLRILGDDWSDAVKDESEWRLNLYKDWLWTLHDGVGDPLVESPSERMRRKERARRRMANDRSRRSPPPRSQLETKKRRESSKD